MKIVITQTIRFDELVFKHYGNLDHFDDLVALNEELVGKPILELGDEIEFPIFEAKQPEFKAETLWD